MLSGADWAFIQNKMRSGGITLFLGAGFSVDGKNAQGDTPPVGDALGKRLAEEMSIDYQGDPLPTVFDVARKRLGEQKLLALMRQLYSISEYEDWYKHLPLMVWHRIYSTNIDDLLDVVYRDSQHGQKLDRIVCPAPPTERDQLFDQVQCVHLHGHVDAPHAPLTFTFDQFASLTSGPNPWYQQLIEDMFSTPVIFVGTQLQDSPFHHYLETRGIRERGQREYRPKSFLIDPKITPVREEQLAQSNIVPVKATGAKFFSALRSKLPETETSIDVVRRKSRPDLTIEANKPIPTKVVARHFALIRKGYLPPSPEHGESEQFFLGAEPDWSDIELFRDAERQVGQDLVRTLLEETKTNCWFLHGPAGCGKTTTAMRAAVQLSEQNRPVWYASIAERIDLQPLLDHIHNDPSQTRHYIFMDVAARHIDSVAAVISRVSNSPRVTLVLVDRTNAFANKRHSLTGLELREIRVPDLTDQDILNILDRLRHFKMLGKLKGKNEAEQVEAFRRVAEKQILVAMREATSGRGFDLIIRNEYSDLASQAKMAYLIACLTVSQGAPGVYKRHLMACMDRSNGTKAIVIDELLRGVLVRANTSGTLLKPRHRRIAQLVAKEIAHDDEKQDAVIRFLSVVSKDVVPGEIRRRSPAFLGYRGLINSSGLWDLFSDRSLVPQIYESVKDLYSEDFLYWLHYGMVNMEAGHYDVAENYLNQSLGIRSDNYQTIHQLGILHLRIAINSPEPSLSVDRANEGIEILRKQIAERGLTDSYPFAAYLKYVLEWYCTAEPLISEREWQSLRDVAKRAKELYGGLHIIDSAAREVERLYMMRAVARSPGVRLAPSEQLKQLRPSDE